MTLAYFKFRYELNEPTAGTPEETEAASLQRRRAVVEAALPGYPQHDAIALIVIAAGHGAQRLRYIAPCQPSAAA